ncbi:hypothetical protein ACFQ07_01790 [Actinomadura adrarensis]|uniref:Uncharacterized protein n=1 Tax=Actinomadura adrarensis TaxID=1819600 RepID=A0ABW3C9J7_9ACTN
MLGRLLAAPGSRTVALSSLADRLPYALDFDDLHSRRSYHWMRAYAAPRSQSCCSVRNSSGA